MFKANQENFLKVYFSGLKVQTEVYLMSGWINIWWCSDSGYDMFLVSPETHHQYLKFVEQFERSKPLLAELR